MAGRVARLKSDSVDERSNDALDRRFGRVFALRCFGLLVLVLVVLVVIVVIAVVVILSVGTGSGRHGRRLARLRAGRLTASRRLVGDWHHYRITRDFRQATVHRWHGWRWCNRCRRRCV